MLSNTLKFIGQLKENNNKTWLEAQKPDLLIAKNEFSEVVDQILKSIVVFDKSVEGLQAKDCIFRIYRDIRFSLDKTPYKNHFGAFFCEGRTQSPGPGYYLHVEPGDKSFIGGGIYMPLSPILQKIRQEIDYNGSKLDKILSEPTFKKYFNGLSGEDKLSRPPKGYFLDNPHIELLKLKSFVTGFNISDEEIVKGDIVKLSENVFKAMYPLQLFLKEAID
ncbi:MAG: DUF2461 domain-containing protein [Opitutaceae bacterium]|nr:DUF2461 domain-containing protein [Cytophagales bacterium]